MISFKTTNPTALLAAIKKAIDDKKITTWTYNANGYFTHNPDQWRGKGWLLPSVVTGVELRFGIVRPQNGNISSEVYAVYHGRFIEMMLAHFDSQFDTSAATAMPTAADRVAA